MGSAAVWKLHRVQVNRTAARLIVQAGRAEKEGRLDRAVADLGAYLALRPDDEQVVLHHAQLLDRAATTQEGRVRACLAYERVLQRRPGRVDVRGRLAELLVVAGRFREARTQLRVLRSSNADSLDLKELLGRCDAASGDAVSAARWYREVLDHDPGRRVAALGLAALLRGELQDPTTADRVMDDRVASAPESFQSWLDRARYRRVHNLSGWDEDLIKARSLAPDDAEILLEVARASGRRGRFDEARSALLKGLEKHPADVRLWAALGDLELSAGRPQAALTTFRSGLDRNPNDPTLLWSLACLSAERGWTSELESAFAALRSHARHYPAAALDYLAAWVAYRHGRPDDAAATLERAQPNLHDQPELQARANLLLARAHGAMGRTAFQIADCERVLAFDSMRAEARFLLAEGLLVQGRYDRAVKEARQALAERPEDGVMRRDWARLVLRHGPRAEVEPALLAVIASGATPSEEASWARRTLAVWLAGAGDRTRIREAFGLLDADPTDSETRRTRARLTAALGGLADRRAALALLDRPNPSVEDRLLLASLHESVGDWPRARDQIETLSRLPTLARSELGPLAEALLRHGEIDAAASLIGRLDASEPWHVATVMLKAQLANARGDAAASTALLTSFARDHAEAALPLARLLETLGQPREAERLYRRAARDSKERWGLALAAFLGRQSRTAEAQAVCEEVAATQPAEVVADALVEIHDMASPTADPAPLDRAARWVEDAIIAHPELIRLRDSLATLREFQGRYDQAERLYRESLKSDPNDLVALNNLAFLLAVHGRSPQESLSLIERALECGGRRAALLDTRAVVRLTRGDHAGAVADLEEALITEPSSPLYFHLAQALLGRGQPDEALHAYRKIAIHQTPSGLRRITMEERLRPGTLQAIERLTDRMTTDDLTRPRP